MEPRPISSPGHSTPSASDIASSLPTTPTPLPPRLAIRRQTLILLVVLWAACLAFAVKLLAQHELQAGENAVPPDVWPADSSVIRAYDQSTLLLFAHPRCPCTSATLAELARIMAQSGGTVKAIVLFTRPDGIDSAWVQSSHWKTAAPIPGVEVRDDPDGAEARRFNAHTSGQVVMYDRAGRLRFSGGITISRGHEGPNAGHDAVLMLTGERDLSAVATTPVFGCRLRSLNDECIGGRLR